MPSDPCDANNPLAQALDCARACLAEVCATGYTDEVVVRTRTFVGGTIGKGIYEDVDVTLTPRPRVAPVPMDYRGTPGGKTAEGSRRVSGVSLTYTRADLQDTHLPDGVERFYLVDGLPFRMSSEPVKQDMAWTFDLARMEARKVSSALAAQPNVAPVNIVPPSLVGTRASGSTLIINPGAWTGYPTPGLTYGVTLDDVVVPGATATTWTDTDDTITQILRAFVVGTNAAGSATAYSQPLVIGSGGGGSCDCDDLNQQIEDLTDALETAEDTLASLIPTPTVAPAITPGGDLGVGAEWSVSTGAWTYTPSTYAYRWTRAGSPIAGATLATYTTVEADVDLLVSAQVAATNPAGTSGWVSATGGAVVEDLDPPVWTMPPAPDPLSEPWAGGTITWTDGTVTDADSVTYDVRVGGVGQGVTADSWVVPSGIVGSSVLRRGSATNSAGTATEDSAALTIVDLVPFRASSVDLYLRDSVGQITDSGSPDYAYDGTSGSALIYADAVGSDGDPILAGDEIGTLYALDDVTGTAVGTVVGAPYTLRTVDGLSASFADARRIDLTPGTGAAGTVLVREVTRTDSNLRHVYARRGNAGLQVGFNNVTFFCRLFSTAGAQIGGADVAVVLPLSVPMLIASEYDDATPGGGTGTLKSAVYRLDTGALLASATATYATAAADSDAAIYVGRGRTANQWYTGPALIYEEFSTKIITNGAIADVVDGSDPTAGGTRTRSIGSLRSGVYDPADATRLVYAAGSGAALTAGGSI